MVLVSIMLQSSSRVKLNRVALKDISELKLVPRRRRVSKSPNTVTDERKEQEETPLVYRGLVRDGASVSYLTDRMGAEKMPHNIPGGEPEDTCVGTQKEKRKPCVSAYRQVKQEGPCTRGKYHQRKPNTRSKSMLDHVRKLNLKLRFTWCCCCYVTPNASVKQGQQIPKMSCELVQTSEARLASLKNTWGRTPSGRKASAGRSSQINTFRRRKFTAEGRAAQVAKRDRDRERQGQSKGRVSASGSEPQPAAETRHGSTGAPPVPTGLPSKANCSCMAA